MVADLLFSCSPSNELTGLELVSSVAYALYIHLEKMTLLVVTILKDCKKVKRRIVQRVAIYMIEIRLEKTYGLRSHNYKKVLLSDMREMFRQKRSLKSAHENS